METIKTNSKYEYYLQFWGGVQNKDQNWIVKDLGIYENDFWFDSEKERLDFKIKLFDVAKKHGSMIMFDEKEGINVRIKTIATMRFLHPNGKLYYYREDFGYAYPKDSAKYIFEDGNYSCDCNRSLFLSRSHKEVEEMECGDEIKMFHLKVSFE